MVLESIRYLLAKDRNKEAYEFLTKIAQYNNNKPVLYMRLEGVAITKLNFKEVLSPSLCKTSLLL